MNSDQSEPVQNHQELQADTTSSPKTKRKGIEIATPKVSKAKVKDTEIDEANELMMQAWDMISKRKNSASDAQTDL